jgi:putative phosphoribosyl transferase
MFADREDAGRRLAAELKRLAETDPLLQAGPPVVIALPRGGVPVALPAARALGAPLDVVLVRKVGAPGQPELAAAAVVDGETPAVARNEDVIAFAGLDEAEFDLAVQRQLDEIERRRALWFGGRERPALGGRVVYVVDDGIATGATARAALTALRAQGSRALALAVPVAPADGLEAVEREADRLVALERPERFGSVGAHYRRFGQVPDAEVTRALARAADADAAD